jgi:hypothetical protein
MSDEILACVYLKIYVVMKIASAKRGSSLTIGARSTLDLNVNCRLTTDFRESLCNFLLVDAIHDNR